VRLLLSGSARSSTPGGVILSNASGELAELSHALSCGDHDAHGDGGVPGSDPLSLGMLGMHGTYAANMSISTSDVILAVGARFDDRVTGKISEFAPHAKIIHIDIDPRRSRRTCGSTSPIVGDVKDVLRKMIKLVKGRKRRPRTRERPPRGAGRSPRGRRPTR